MGPTGSGKSRLLADDIEWGGPKGDTPTKNSFSNKWEPMDAQKRFSPKL